MRRLVSRVLPRNQFVRNVSIVAGGTALAQILAIASAPVLTRIYRPSDFGALQIFISVMGLILVVASGRYEIAVLLPEDDQSAIELLVLSLTCVVMTTAFCGVVVVVCHYHWILPSSMLVLQKWLWLLPLSLLGGGLYECLNYWAVRRDDYKQIAKSKFSQVAAQIATQLASGCAIHGPLGLLLGDAAGRMCGSGRFARDLWKDFACKLRAVQVQRVFRLAFRYREYPLVSMWGALINGSGLALPALFLAQYYGARETGCFALVNRVLGIPGSLIGVSIAQVYISQSAKLSRSDPSRLMQIFLKTTRHMVFIGVLPCAVFTLVAPWLFKLIFGPAWRDAGEYARYLAFMFYASFIDAPLTQTLNILEQQRVQFGWDLSRLIAIVASIVIPHWLGYGASVAILAYGIAMTVMYCIHWTQSYFGISRRVQRSIRSVVEEAPAS